MTNHTDTSRSGDLVASLRALSAWLIAKNLDLKLPDEIGDPDDAADRIEADGKHIAELDGRAMEYLLLSDKQALRIAKLEAALTLCADRIEALEAENERLRGALKPFAKAGEIAGEPSPYGDWYAYRPAAGDEYAIFGQHLRDARAALGEKQ